MDVYKINHGLYLGAAFEMQRGQGDELYKTLRDQYEAGYHDNRRCKQTCGVGRRENLNYLSLSLIYFIYICQVVCASAFFFVFA